MTELKLTLQQVCQQRDKAMTGRGDVDEAQREWGGWKARAETAESDNARLREALRPAMIGEVTGPNMSPQLHLVFSTNELMQSASDAIRAALQGGDHEV